MTQYSSYKHAFIPMRETCGHICIKKLGIVNPTTCVYRFIIYNPHKHSVATVKLFIMNMWGLWLNLNSCMAHMFYS